MKHETSFLAAIVQKCSSTTSIRIARQLHAQILIISATFTSPFASPFLYNNLLSIYAKCGSLHDSQRVFDRMPQRNIVSFNALISAYSRLPHHALSAIRLLTVIKNEGFIPNNLTFSSLIQASSLLEEHFLGSALHSQVVRYGFLNGVCVQTSLLGMYSNCGDLESANQVFRHIVDRDAIAWNSIIFSNLKNQKIMEGIQVFGSMVKDGMIPTDFTYSMVLNACSRIRDGASGKVIHAHVIKSDSPADVPLQNALLDMYSSCGETETAWYVFKNIKNPDLVSWNSMISGYSERGVGDKAMDLFIQLLRTSFKKPDEYTYAAVISASGMLPASGIGKPLHAQVEKTGFQQSVFVGSTLVSMYLKNGDTGSAEKIFSLVPEKDNILWTEMITGHSKLGDGETALKYFYYMQQEGHKADSFALSSALSSSADLATLIQGEMLHALVVKTGYRTDVFVCGSLIDMYAKNGNLQAAQLVFSGSIYPDLKCWNSLLGGYSNHGKADDAFKLFDEMMQQGLKPDEVTFISLLSACSHRGLVSKGKFFWNYMKENNLEPGPKHYSCMVSLLGRAGLLQEAMDLILKLPTGYSYPELWRILLSSSVIYKNLGIGISAAEEILRLEPEDNATHILLSNLYAAVGRWDAVADIRKNIKRLMLEKDPGLSWIEVRDSTHAFSSNDQTHPRVNEAEAELYRLYGNITGLETH